MNRSDALSFADPIPLSLGKALTKEQLAERGAAVARTGQPDASFNPSVPPTWAVERAAQAWCAPTTEGIVMDEVLAWEFARILAVEAGELSANPGEVVRSREPVPGYRGMNDLIRKANASTRVGPTMEDPLGQRGLQD